MATPPYAKVLIARNGGAFSEGPVVAQHSDVIQLAAESTIGWTNQKWEIFDFGTGFTVPAGWSTDPETGTFFSNAVLPPSFTLPAAAAIWGKWLFRLRINDAISNDEAEQRFSDTAGLQVNSASGLQDSASGELNEFDDFRQWVTALKANWRTLEINFAQAPGGGAPSGAAGGDLGGTFPNPDVLRVHGTTVPVSTGAAAGNVLQLTGIGVAIWAAVNLAGGVNFVTGTLPIGNGGTGQTSFAAGVLHSNGSVLSSSLIVNADITPATINLDKFAQSGATGTNTQFIGWSGSAWVPITITAGGAGAVPTSRQILGSSPIRINGGASATLAADITVSVLSATTGALGVVQLAGDLDGTATAVVVSRINGTGITTPGGGLTPGQPLRVTTINTADWGPLDLANPNATTGALPINRGGTGVAALGAGVVHSNGSVLSSSPVVDADIANATITFAKFAQNGASGTNTQFIGWTGAAWAPLTVSAAAAGAVPTSRTLTGTTPIQIDGVNTPVDLSVNRTFSVLAATTLALGVVQLAGDLGGTGAAPSTLRLRGTSITTAGGGLLVGQALRATGLATADWGPIDLNNPNAVTGTLSVTVLPQSARQFFNEPSIAQMSLLDMTTAVGGEWCIIRTSEATYTFKLGDVAAPIDDTIVAGSPLGIGNWYLQ